MKIGIKTMGCRLNHAEAATMAGALEYEGHEVVGGNETCEALVLHTCAVTGSAQREAMRLARSAKRAGVGCVVMSGCTASIADAERLFEAGVDVIVGKKPGDVRGNGGETALRIGGLVSQALAGDGLSAYLPRFSSTRASVKVQDGCDFRCAYCIIPDARGNPRSRPFGEILREVAGLAAKGYREVVLTGVNVACWQDDGRRLADLAEAASQVEGVARIRLSSVEPGTTERAIVDLMAGARSRLCHTLHYPLQSGDAGILKRMRRRYTPRQYGAAVEYALGKIPRLGLGADVITGFPGEDDAAFQETVRMVERYPFGNLHVFPYSERPGTPAAAMEGIVPVTVRRERARELIGIANRKREEFASSFVGVNAEVLVEGVDGKGVGKGWTGEYVEARMSGLREADVGTLVEMKVSSAGGAIVSGVGIGRLNAPAPPRGGIHLKYSSSVPPPAPAFPAN